ncbi:hypothetical protein [Streptomyces hokutonensis]|uniref:hypothetical protein n=1 Tax=Streptomyces hokutonensis TaxID=1306990 RepID=UPI00381DE563
MQFDDDADLDTSEVQDVRGHLPLTAGMPVRGALSVAGARLVESDRSGGKTAKAHGT